MSCWAKEDISFEYHSGSKNDWSFHNSSRKFHIESVLNKQQLFPDPLAKIIGARWWFVSLTHANEHTLISSSSSFQLNNQSAQKRRIKLQITGLITRWKFVRVYSKEKLVSYFWSYLKAKHGSCHRRHLISLYLKQQVICIDLFLVTRHFFCMKKRLIDYSRQTLSRREFQGNPISAVIISYSASSLRDKQPRPMRDWSENPSRQRWNFQ